MVVRYDYGMQSDDSKYGFLRSLHVLAAACGIAVTAGGCSQQPQPINDATFYREPAQRSIDQHAGIRDEPIIAHDSGKQSAPEEAESVERVSATVAQTIKSPTDTALQVDQPSESTTADDRASSTRPAASSQPTVTLETGQYLTIGAVVAEVNGTPIYADRVLAWVQKDLAAKAREMGADTFHQYAAQQLNKSRDYFINNELVFAAAQRTLNKKERDLADVLTTAWRQRKITESGGSIELARRAAQADGLSFDEMVHEQYRTFMAQIYYQKKVMPRIQITVKDLRDYYTRHLQDEFTDTAQVRFRLIKIDPNDVGGREQAISRVKELQEKAAKGFDFAELAKTYNRDPLLQRNAGDSGWIDQGAFRLEKVEQAVWKLQPGQVTQDFIEEDGAFYIARLEERKLGRVAPFEDPSVQETIQKKLRAEQFQTLQGRTMDMLRRDATIDLKNNNLDIVVDMAMQRYPQWHESK